MKAFNRTGIKKLLAITLMLGLIFQLCGMLIPQNIYAEELEEQIYVTLTVSGEESEEADKTALQDKVDEVAGFEEEDYMAEGWEIFVGALADARAVLDDEEAVQETIDDALLDLETAVAGLEKIALRIIGDGVANPLVFVLAELEEMDPYRQKYSTINTYPTKSWYVAEGVTLRELFELAQIDYEIAKQIIFTSTDGFKATFTVQELLRDERFMFPYFRENHEYFGYIPGSSREAVEVEAILALKDANTDDFGDMEDKNSLHLVYGQRAQTEQTNATFAKYVNKVEVLTEAPEKWPVPTVNVQPGTVEPGTKVELSSIYNDTDKVHYTLDGSVPTVDSPMYNWIAARWSNRTDFHEINKPIEITKDTTIKAVVIGPSKEDSDIVTFTYKVESEIPSHPDFVVENGVLTEYIGSGGDVIIPEDMGITVIGPRVFDANKEIVSVTIPEGITEIGMQCFRNCSNLVSVTFPETLIKMDSVCFFNCSGLTEVVLPDGLAEIGNSIFYGCSGLTDVVLPNGLMKMGNQVFQGCGENLASVTFLNETTVFGGTSIFTGCPNVIIYGYADSTAEVYAGENDIPFGTIGDLDKTALRTRVEEVENYKSEDYTGDSWAGFATALVDAQDVLEDKEATQDDVDQALEALNEAINGLEIAPIPLTVVVEKDGVEIDTIEYDLSEWEDVKRQNYSAMNSKSFYRLGSAEGVSLIELLNDAEIDIDGITGFNFVATDGWETFVSKSELLDEERYYYPNIFGDNKEEGAIEVEPILALKSYVEDSGELPSWDIIDKLNTIRLFVGQKDPDDINYSMFAKLICRLEVEVEAEEPTEPIPLTVVVKGTDGTEISTAEYDMSEWEDVKRQHYSARDSLPSNRLASAEGVFLTDLLESLEIDIDSIIGFNFVSTDGYGSFISKSELLDVKRYYYPNIHEENQEEDAVEIGPMLALRSYVAARGSTEAPSWDIIDDYNTIRLFIGQENPDDANYGGFAKWICELEIEVEVEEPEVEVTYETAQDVTNIEPDSVTFVPNQNNFVVPAYVTEFTFEDGEKIIKAIYEEEKWIFEAEYIPFDVIIRYADGSEVEHKDYNIAAHEDIKKQNYSTRDRFPDPRIASRLVAAEGVFVRDLLRTFDIDVDDVVNFGFYTSDDTWPTPISKSELFDAERYYYPNICEEDQEEGKEPVEPMLALRAYVCDRYEYELPSWDATDYLNSVRLFYGQTNPADTTYNNCIKWARRVEVELDIEEPTEPIPLTVVVKGTDGTEISTAEYDMSEWEDVKRQHYSARDSLPSNRLASAEGVFLTDLLESLEIDIDSIIGFNFVSTDGYGSFISKSELLDVKRYYYPNIHEENQEEDAVEIGPMLALRSYVAARGSTEAPSWDIIDDYNTIRLFIGQENPDDANYGRFAKWICELEIEVEVEEPEPKYELNVEGDDDYTIKETEVGIELTLQEDVMGFKHFGATVRSLAEEKLGQLEVIFTHLEDNAQQSLISIKADFDSSELDARAGFNIKPSDVIRVYMVDELTNETDRNPIIFK